MLRLKHFLIQDDRVIIDKILLGIVKNEKTDYKLTVVKINFSIKNCNTLIKKKCTEIKYSGQRFISFCSNIGQLHDQKGFISRRPVQKLETYIFGPFQLYFSENLFGAIEKSKILEHKKLTKKDN